MTGSGRGKDMIEGCYAAFTAVRFNLCFNKRLAACSPITIYYLPCECNPECPLEWVVPALVLKRWPW